MPYEIVKKRSGKYQVINRLTGEIHAKGTTLNKAKAQVRLLESKMRGAGSGISGNVQVRPDLRQGQLQQLRVERAYIENRIREFNEEIRQTDNLATRLDLIGSLSNEEGELIRVNNEIRIIQDRIRDDTDSEPEDIDSLVVEVGDGRRMTAGSFVQPVNRKFLPFF